MAVYLIYNLYKKNGFADHRWGAKSLNFLVLSLKQLVEKPVPSIKLQLGKI